MGKRRPTCTSPYETKDNKTTRNRHTTTLNYHHHHHHNPSALLPPPYTTLLQTGFVKTDHLLFVYKISELNVELVQSKPDTGGEAQRMKDMVILVMVVLILM